MLRRGVTVGVVISNWSLGGAVDYVFPIGSWLPPRSYLVIAANPPSFRAVYRVVTAGPYRGRLSAAGEELLLRDQDGEIVNSVAFSLGFPWPTPNDLADESIGLINSSLDNGQPGAWRSGKASPGRANAVLMDNAPPFADQIEHTPQSPREWDTIKIRAHVTDADGVAAVNLQLQPVAPGGYVRRTDGQYNDRWSTVPMLAAGGDWYEAVLPASMRYHRWLIRYRIDVVDKGGRQLRLPYWDDPQPNFALYIFNGVPAWQGAVKPGDAGWFGQVQTYDFSQMRPLPVYQLVANSGDVADAQFIPWSNYGSGYMGNDYPWYGTLVYNGVVYDHIRYRARGGEFRYAAGKKSLEV
ncbi:MAG: lamin tail domain-containing protein [Anaerolineales bacterium]|nr:lamin tail domain-containing protein [Anaerolineales bacterium]